MCRTRLLTLPSIIVLVALHAGAPPASARDDTPPEIAATKNPVVLDAAKRAYYAKQFKANCARCHGARGDGGGDDAAAQPVPPADLTDATRMAARSDGELYWQIRTGGAPRSEMPAFGPGSAKSWNDEKLWGMVAFLRTLAEPSED
jgi:mono/diheme cytochrome c family protein